MKRTLAFFGAFNPPTKAHIDLAEYAMRATARDDVIYVPSKMEYIRYEQKKNLKAQRRNTAAQKIKEVKFHINIDDHDYQTKIKKALDFLEKKFRLKITLALRGREMAHQDMAFELIKKVMAELAPYADADGAPSLLGRNISVTFAPK